MCKDSDCHCTICDTRCEHKRVYLTKVRHRQTFEAANFCTPLGQGGSTLSAKMSVYGALLLEKMPPGGMVILTIILHKLHPIKLV